MESLDLLKAKLHSEAIEMDKTIQFQMENIGITPLILNSLVAPKNEVDWAEIDIPNMLWKVLVAHKFNLMPLESALRKIENDEE